MDALVRNGLSDELQLLSQTYLKNGFAQVRFGLHNQRGIFGACPGEMRSPPKPIPSQML